MKGNRPRKKSVHEVDRELLREPLLSATDQADYEEGWRLFNEHRFWDAHEAWERVWIRRPEDSRIFFQGIIQLAAAYHLMFSRKRYGGARRNLEKAEEKLRLFPSVFLRVDTALLLGAIRKAKGALREGMHDPDPAIAPRVGLLPDSPSPNAAAST